MRHRILTAAVAAALLLAAAPSASAFFFDGGEEVPVAYDLAKNGLAGETLSFTTSDFHTDGGELDAIVLSALPDSQAGTLTLGGQLLRVGDVISMNAVDGLRYTPKDQTAASTAQFKFLPVFSNGTSGAELSADLYLLAEENSAPVARDLELTTYKNVAVTERFDGVDPEGDLLTYHVVKKPARGAVTIQEDGTFIYTPYENKTGKDTFTYVAVDAVGNSSAPATVKVKIEKPDTKVTYSDLDGHPAQKAAIRLAEENIFVGECMNGAYFFQPDTTVTRSQFVTMVMNTVGMEALEGVERTGFADDDAIETWAKPYVSSALKSGLIQGSRNEAGQVVFQGDGAVTTAEAAVLLDRALQVTDVDAQTFADGNAPAWAAQSAANLTTCGVLESGDSLGTQLTRGEAAQLLCASLELLDSRDTGWF